MSAWELTNITAHLVLPPGVFILLALAGLAFARTHARFGMGLTLVSILALGLLAMPAVSRPLIRSLEVPYADPTRERTPEAIVVLGGGSYLQAPEYGGDTVSSPTLERLRYGAYLHRRTGKPLLVTGGNPTGAGSSEGEQMRNALRDFGATARWVESQSNNTFENARLSQQTLKKAGIQSVYLVTHAWHMPRARLAFERAGMHVTPAPMAYKTASKLKLLDFVPSAGGLNDSYVYFHEVLGMIWYRLKFDLGQ